MKDAEWILKKAAQEDGCFVSAGADERDDQEADLIIKEKPMTDTVKQCEHHAYIPLVISATHTRDAESEKKETNTNSNTYVLACTHCGLVSSVKTSA